MSDIVRQTSFVVLLAAGLASLAAPLATERRLRPLAAFVAVAAVQTLALFAPLALGWQLGGWNWTGKLASTAVSLAAVRILRLTRREAGLVMPHGRAAWRATLAGLAAGLVFTALFVLLVGPNTRPDAETLAYEATMPGLDEELAYRGIAMALLARGLPATRSALPVRLLPAIVTSLQFTAIHMAGFQHGHLVWAPGVARLVLPIGLLLALIRVYGRSLFGCVLTHNAVNLALFLAAFLPARP